MEACAPQVEKAPVQHQRSSAAKDKNKFNNNKYIKTKINHKGKEGNYQFGQKKMVMKSLTAGITVKVSQDTEKNMRHFTTKGKKE